MKKNIPQKNRGRNRGVGAVQEEFTGKNMTRFGGSGLIRRFFKRHRIKEKIKEAVHIEGRRESKYSPGAMFISMLYGMFLGLARPSHMEVFCADKVFQKVAGLGGFPVQSTMSRFLSGLRAGVARQIASLNLDLLIKFRKGFKRFWALTLDMDSHVTTVYGDQQRAGLGYNPKKKGRKSYHPLFCFIGETRDYIGGMMRSGKHHTSYNAITLLKGIIKKLPSHIKKIRVRADSGFFSLEMLKFLAGCAIEFYIVVPMQPWVQRKIKSMSAWRSIGGGVNVSECEYILTQNITTRMVVIRQRVGKGESPRKQLKLLKDVVYDYQVIVTNSSLLPEDVWRFYNKRACCENFIKEGIYGFGLDKVISQSWGGNCAYFELLMLAYNLMNFFKEEVLNQKKTKNMIQVIRDRLFLIPGKLVYTSRRWVLRLEESWFFRDDYEEALARLS